MTPLDEFLLRIPILSLLAYVPFICYADVKWREIPHRWWFPLWGVNAPILAYFYWEGLYPFFALPVSLVMCGIFWVLMRRDYIQGADMLFLWAVSLFFVTNPYPLPHGIEQFPFYAFLIATMLITAPVLLVLNYYDGERRSVLSMMSHYPGGVPFILPISAALVLTVMFG